MLTMGTVTLGDCNSVTACSEQAMLTTGTVMLGDCLFCVGNGEGASDHAKVIFGPRGSSLVFGVCRSGLFPFSVHVQCS